MAPNDIDKLMEEVSSLLGTAEAQEAAHGVVVEAELTDELQQARNFVGESVEAAAHAVEEVTGPAVSLLGMQPIALAAYWMERLAIRHPAYLIALSRAQDRMIEGIEDGTYPITEGESYRDEKGRTIREIMDAEVDRFVAEHPIPEELTGGGGYA